ncbi:dicarboxylate/amino acid:cation symporter [bacterium]|nr:dicarboxylate/amino acid:cation symporter [bacterium]
MQLTTKIFIGMFFGVLFGVTCRALPDLSINTWLTTWVFEGFFDVVGKIFIASLKVLVVPMVFVSLVCGTAALGGHGRMGPMAFKAIALYMVTTAIAITIALTISGITQPGAGQQLTADVDYVAKAAPSFKEVLINIFPSNPIQAMADGNMLQVIVFSILFGLAVSRAGEQGQRVRQSFTAYNDIIMEMVMLLMRLAPYGVFCLLATIFYKTGFGLIRDLASYFFTVVAALLIHALCVYTSLLKLLSGLSPWHFLKQVRPVMMFGFYNASRNATMHVHL